jgi:hypothetical protein
MAALSYSILFQELSTGQGLEAVQASTNAPSSGSGSVEIRIDQTAAVTDASVAGGLRPLTSGDVLSMLNYLTQYYIRDTNKFQQ